MSHPAIDGGGSVLDSRPLLPNNRNSGSQRNRHLDSYTNEYSLQTVRDTSSSLDAGNGLSSGQASSSNNNEKNRRRSELAGSRADNGKRFNRTGRPSVDFAEELVIPQQTSSPRQNRRNNRDDRRVSAADADAASRLNVNALEFVPETGAPGSSRQHPRQRHTRQGPATENGGSPILNSDSSEAAVGSRDDPDRDQKPNTRRKRPPKRVRAQQQNSAVSSQQGGDAQDSRSDTTADPSQNIPGAQAATQSQNQNQTRRQAQKPQRTNNSKATASAPVPAPDEDLLTTLEKGLSNGSYECMVCFDIVKQRDRTWGCSVCFAVFHLNCIDKWGRKSISTSNANPNVESSMLSSPSSNFNNLGSSSTLRGTSGGGGSGSGQVGWRCPGCQNVSPEIPSTYFCFCGKTPNPQYNRYLVPHTCEQPCLRERPKPCTHRCSMQCHPGPCPPCEALAPPVSCYCGRTEFVMRCVDVANINVEKSCGDICGKQLDCGKHRCDRVCHSGPCQGCAVKVTQSCHCSRHTREVPCSDSSTFITDRTVYSCGGFCHFEYRCGVHKCTRKCHEVSRVHSDLCPTDPAVIKRCPCGAQRLEEDLGVVRTSCQDAVPVCQGVCGKVLACGHRCPDNCHRGDCRPCKQALKTQCRCGRTKLEVLCVNIPRDPITGEALPPLCNRPCKAQKHCKRHKCTDVCCPLDVHICDLVCGKNLKCGKHTCTLPCGHDTRCHDCFEGVTFDELSCNCGRTVMYPPIPCNTPIPKCSHPCVRPLQCGHQSLSPHTCHPDSEPCPPCVMFVERACACGKKTMKNVPCSRQGLPSCGQVCGRIVDPCGHACGRFCHSGPCVDENNRCLQRCGRTRAICGHNCGFQCHGRPFCTEDKPCRENVQISCRCGNKVSMVQCGAWKESMGRSDTTIPCDESCAMMERNRKVAEALELSVPGVTAPSIEGSDGIAPTPALPATIAGFPREFIVQAVKYGETMVKYAITNLAWVKSVEATLFEFVSDTSRRSYNFPHAKKQHNMFLLRLAPHYNLIAETYDSHYPTNGVGVRKRGAGSATLGGVSTAVSLLSTPIVPTVTVSTVAEKYKAAMFAPATVAAVTAYTTAVTAAAPGTASSKTSSAAKMTSSIMGSASAGSWRKSGTTAVTGSAATSASSRSEAHKPVNAYHMSGLQYGIQASDIRILMEPIMSDCDLKIDVLGGDEATMIAAVRVAPKDANDSTDAVVELALLARLDAVREKFIRDRGYVRAVELCFVKDVVAEKDEEASEDKSESQDGGIEVVYTVEMAGSKAGGSGGESHVEGGRGGLGSGANRFGILDADGSTKSAKKALASKSGSDVLDTKEVKKLSEVHPDMEEWDDEDAVEEVGEDKEKA
ncbi:hypothetical protein BJ742DRAFT_786354 [Cladochytrium replicatum]|nr:hypothetical protein BJ742DRAFT_786354 [Cladochytrium replicatum]